MGADLLAGGKSARRGCGDLPRMLGDAFRRLQEFQALPQPVLVVTSEFGTVSMWDWEINSFLGCQWRQGDRPQHARKNPPGLPGAGAGKMLRARNSWSTRTTPPAPGCRTRSSSAFTGGSRKRSPPCRAATGCKWSKRASRSWARAAKAIPDEAAQQVWDGGKAKTPLGKVASRQVLSAVKLYMKVKEDLDADPAIIAVGMNCLNKSMYSDTTPCLAWNLLYEDRKLVWGCEGDLVSMLTEVLISKTIAAPFMMTNLYPFVMGQAALKHEHIPNFPEVEGDPQDYILAAHCGYLGVVPQSFSTEWALRDKVLAIVDDNATALDARLPEGPITLVKLAPPFDRWSLIEGRPGEICPVSRLALSQRRGAARLQRSQDG